MRQPLELLCSPEASTRMPALASCSWYAPISSNRLSVGITPASESPVALTRIMNFIDISLRSRRFYTYSRMAGPRLDNGCQRLFRPRYSRRHSRGSVAHRYRDCAVQLDDWRRVVAREHVV